MPYRKRWLAPCFVLLSLPVMADEGVLFDFVLTERRSEADVSVHEFGFLIHFDKHAAADLGGKARLEVEAHDADEYASVELSLFDYDSAGARFHVGALTVDAPFGQTTAVSLQSDAGGVYSLDLTPRRGTIGE